MIDGASYTEDVRSIERAHLAPSFVQRLSMLDSRMRLWPMDDRQ